MKKHIFTLILMIACFYSTAQITFQKTYKITVGNAYSHSGYSVQQTTDGGYVIAGNTSSSSFDDIFLIKTNANGDSLWMKTFGGNYDLFGFSVQQTTDGGYIIGGRTYDLILSTQVLLIKTDANGDSLWAKTYG